MTEGDRVKLTCSTSCPLTNNKNYIWYLNDQLLQLPEHQNKHLVLDVVTTQHAGKYSCAIGSSILDQINGSLVSGYVPRSYKVAVIKPLLKKPSLDPDVLANYRLISNLPFNSKVLEKVVVTQLLQHLQRNSLFEMFQSGFRAHHSTETALLKVTNDLLIASDHGLVSMLVLLDLSAAFDTVDHSILLQRLEHVIGIKGTALDWFRSYLSDRYQFAHVHGVPSSYTYLSMKPEETEQLVTLQTCLKDIKSWMSSNFLLLNPGKTEVMVFGPEPLWDRLDHMITLDGCPNNSLRSLQLIQNAAARVLTGIDKRDHITPVLRGLAPSYLEELVVTPYQPNRPLRSQNAGLLVVPRVSRSRMGGRAFSYQAPLLWNQLPVQVGCDSAVIRDKKKRRRKKEGEGGSREKREKRTKEKEKRLYSPSSTSLSLLPPLLSSPLLPILYLSSPFSSLFTQPAISRRVPLHEPGPAQGEEQNLM
ncbi:hypothetical protein D4764_06G0004980 [Takifugu flavidus]|uniref:Ig-like domain-containing protein n=1 Tax=Takifugu flavidus TaxID=433684 RepID=A0A5C6MX98_9TELE|nr:hypothetical protein D4764_06G0004980 [Takifugu flavidus]